MFNEKSDCLSLALNSAKREYIALVTIIPIAFLLLEIAHVISKINEGEDTVLETIKVFRTVLSVLSSLAFFWLFLGGMQEYIKKGYRDVRSVWWIVQGLEESFLFALLAIFQHTEYDPNDITTSFWFWACIDVLFGIIIWFILSAGKPKIPGQKWVWWIKSAQLIWLTAWLGYRPTNRDFDAATIITLLVCLLLSYIYFSQSSVKTWGILVVLIPGLFLISFIVRSTVLDTLAIEWVYLISMLIAIILYIAVVIRTYIGFDDDVLPSI